MTRPPLPRLSALPAALAGLVLATCESPAAPVGAPAAAFTVPPSDPAAFVHVDVAPMTSPTLLHDQTVLVRNGRITRVAPAGEVDVPADAMVIDGSGRVLMPGLVDMHVHLADSDHMLLYLANGVTTVRNMWGFAEILHWRAEVRDGTRLGPRIYSASPGFDGNPPSWPGTIVVTDPAQADADVAAQIEAGYDYIKVYQRLQPAPYHAILESAHARGIPAVGHIPTAVSLEEALASGQASIEHLGGFAAPVMGHGRGSWEGTPDPGRLAEVAGEVRTSGSWVCPTLWVQQSFPNQERASTLEARPEMRYVDPATRGRWGPVAGALSNERNRAWARSRGRFVRALEDAGVPLLLGTDSWISYTVPGFSLHDELRLMVQDADLTPYEALRAGTADAARFLGAGDELGAVREGLAADLVLVEGDPLADVANAARRVGVMMGGRWLSEPDLRARLEALAAAYAGS